MNDLDDKAAAGLRILENGSFLLKTDDKDVIQTIIDSEFLIMLTCTQICDLYKQSIPSKDSNSVDKYLELMEKADSPIRRFKCMVCIYRVFEKYIDEDEVVAVVGAELQLGMEMKEEVQDQPTHQHEHKHGHDHEHCVNETKVKVPNRYTCYCCGEEGHKKAKCPHKHERCSNCGKPGHVASTCWKRPKRRCYCCGSESHIKSQCALKFTNCQQCGFKGHTKDTCKRKHLVEENKIDMSSLFTNIVDSVVALVVQIVIEVNVMPMKLDSTAREDVAEKARDVLERICSADAWGSAKHLRRLSHDTKPEPKRPKSMRNKRERTRLKMS